MWIFVACGATPILESVFHGAGLCPRFQRFVAISANNSQMRAGERESRGVVLCQGKSSGPKTLHVVAVLAAVLVRSCDELAFVNIRMTGRALHVLNCKYCINALRYVALCAGNRGVLPFQRIFGFRVLLHIESSCPKTVYRMTEGTIGAKSALSELSPMRIG